MRMRYTAHLLWVLWMPLHAASPNDAAQDVQQIDTLYQQWRQAVETSSIEGYVGILHTDVRLLPPGAAAIQGRDNYANFLGPVFATATYEIEVLRMPEIEVVGDTAIAEYDYTIHLQLKDADRGVTEPGALTDARTTARYFDVLRKENGRWSVWRHSWQEFTPAAP